MPAAETQSLLPSDILFSAVSGVPAAGCSARPDFQSVATDSRSVPPGTLFVPLFGAVQDGHAYIGQALEKGASAVFVAKKSYEADRSSYARLCAQHPRVSFIVVENTLRALQEAAAAYTARFPALVRIGITGSSGKTTTKEMAASVFSQEYRVVVNEGNLNSETGLPLSVFRSRKEHEAGIFEMGMNRRGEIRELASVLHPHFAVITNIGSAHIGILGSRDAIAEEKKEIFSFFTENDTGFVPEDDEYASFLRSGVRGTVRTFGLHSAENVSDVCDRGLNGTSFMYKGLPVQLRLPGAYNFTNALAVISLAEEAGLSAEQIKSGLESVAPVFGRPQNIEGDVTIIQDCYNANPDSLEKAIAFWDSLPHGGRKIYVIADMLELGSCSAEAHENTGELAAVSDADFVVFFGDEMKRAADRAAQLTDRDRPNNIVHTTYES